MNKFRDKFKISELLITKVGGWNISLRPTQVTIGSLVLSLDRSCPNMGGLTPEEGKELGEAFAVIERLLDTTFKPDKLNYLALMMVDHQVHFHVIPRYASPVVFEGDEYKDVSWPKPPNVLEKIELTEENILTIREYFRSKV